MSNTSVTADKGGSKSESLDRPNEMYSFENNALLKSQSLPSDLKVRKPYTITKQREKWTEEEHHRFLEALKLYGRGWRQIEEHVGTKTAVQIRSHAQKFFSKVARESNGSPESFIKPVEIPPPRPKRKPMHPYPRKSVDSLKVTPVSNQLEGFPSSDTLVLDKDKQSPTSVLSALASETLGSAVSDQQNGCSSPASCTTEMQSANLLPVEKENEYATSNSSPQEGKVPLLSAGLNLEDALSTKIEPESKDSECTKGDAMTVPRCKSIRLLGKTILVTGSRKPHPPGAENYKSAISSSSRVIDNVNFVRTLPSKQLETSLVMITTNWNHPFPSGSPCLELQKDYINTAEANPPNECLPSWPLHQGPSLINFLSYNQNSAPTPRESVVQEGLKEKEVPNERSFTGSSTGSVSELDNREKNSDAPVESQYRQPSSSIQPSRSKPAKGFVPYKRCLPEGDIKSPIIESEERERQRSRVCS